VPGMTLGTPQHLLTHSWVSSPPSFSLEQCTWVNGGPCSYFARKSDADHCSSILVMSSCPSDLLFAHFLIQQMLVKHPICIRYRTRATHTASGRPGAAWWPQRCRLLFLETVHRHPCWLAMANKTHITALEEPTSSPVLHCNRASLPRHALILLEANQN
jgi:hypothetical protein